MKTLRYSGETIDYTNAGSAIVAGDPVVLGKRIGIPFNDIAATTGTGALAMEGAHYLAKHSGETFTQGDELFWDDSNNYLTKTKDGNTHAGWAAEAAASADVFAVVNLEEEIIPQIPVIAAVATADASDLATAEALANANKAKINVLIAALKTAGIMAAS